MDRFNTLKPVIGRIKEYFNTQIEKQIDEINSVKDKK